MLSGLKNGTPLGVTIGSVAAAAVAGFIAVAASSVSNRLERQKPTSSSVTAKLFNDSNLAGKQWGFSGTVLVVALFALLSAVLVWHLWAVWSTFAGRVAIVLGVMLISNIMLVLLVMGRRVPRLEISLPLLYDDTTSYIITLGILGFIAGVSGSTPNSRRSGGPTEEATHAN
jgi:hypothetical protein